MIQVTNSNFDNTGVELDNMRYEGCTFTGCDLVYSGHGPIGISNCTFNDCKWIFAAAAQNTLMFMAAIYPHATKLIEETFESVRQNAFPVNKKSGNP